MTCGPWPPIPAFHAGRPDPRGLVQNYVSRKVKKFSKGGEYSRRKTLDI
jgi:hypothetical protein